MTDYSRLPAHMQGAARRYVEQGIPPGSFLTAVLENNLMQAFARADEINTDAMRVWTEWLYWEAPGNCHGSPTLVQTWIEHKGLSYAVD